MTTLRGESPRLGAGRRLARGAVVLGVVALLAAAALGLVRAAEPPPASAPAATRAVASTLRCPTCQGLSVADSPSKVAQSMRDIIREQIDAGRTPDEVRAFFVDRYGPWLLLAPPAAGLGALVWLLPVAAVASGSGLALVFGRRRGGPPPPPVSPQERGQVEAAYAACQAGILCRGGTPHDESVEAALLLLESVRTDGPAGSAPDVRADARAVQQVGVALRSQTAEASLVVAARPVAPLRDAPAAPPVARWRRPLAGAGVAVLFAVLVTGLLSANLGRRGVGELSTGNLPQEANAQAAAEAAAVGLSQLRDAAEAAPDDPLRWRQLADALMGQGQAREAASAYRRALELAPGQPDVRVALAAALLADGAAQAADIELDRVLDEQPDHPEALLVRGLLLTRQGDAMQARRTLERFLETAPDHPAAAMARGLLDDMATP